MKRLKPTSASPFKPEDVLSELVTFQVAKLEWEPLLINDGRDA